MRNISQGGLLMGQVATPAAIKAIMGGEDLKIFAGAVQTAGTNAWVVKKDSPVKTIHDFVGKTVGFTNPGGASEARSSSRCWPTTSTSRRSSPKPPAGSGRT